MNEMMAEEMRNNASSSTIKTDLLKGFSKSIEEGSNDPNDLISKYNNLMKDCRLESSTRASISLNMEGVEAIENQTTPFAAKTISHKCSINEVVSNMKSGMNFPGRFSAKFNNEQSLANMVIQEESEDHVPVAKMSGNMTKGFMKFWNMVITKQDTRCSAVEHQLTEEQAGYFPCQLKTLFNPPESYLKKTYCKNVRYNGPGYELLPGRNQFSKISSKTSAHSEMKRILEYYGNNSNQYFLIPLEFSSKLSRCMLQSHEISQASHGCNKMAFKCQPFEGDNIERHPIFTVRYKESIHMEMLPCANVSLVDNPQLGGSSYQNQSLQMTVFNHPFLSYFLYRSDFWIDDFYSRCWHFSRCFCDKLELGSRRNLEATILMKDSMFNYLISCSTRICVAIKYWILNPEGATYFRCRCGEKIFDVKEESKMLIKMPVGSAGLCHFQQKLRMSAVFHQRHIGRKPFRHTCVCSQRFSDHKLWLAHMFSTNIYDIKKCCPIFLYIFSKHTSKEKRYTCQCNRTFSDYDFWSFWLHSCSCSTLRSVIKTQCVCSLNSQAQRTYIKTISLRSEKKKERESSQNHRSRSRSSMEKPTKEILQEGDGNDVAADCPTTPEFDDTSDENWEPSDKNDIPLTVSRELKSASERWRKRLRH